MLGPILLLVYINGLPDVVDCAIKLFADDTDIFNKINSVEDVDSLQRNCDSMWDWSIIWQLDVNTKNVKDCVFENMRQSLLERQFIGKSPNALC